MGTRPRTIGLLFTNGADRRLLAEFFAERGFEVEAPEPHAFRPREWRHVGLVVTDAASARRHHQALLAMQRASEPELVPILVVLPRHEDAAAWLNAGFDDVLRQPISKAELAARVETFWRLKDQAAELARRLAETSYRAIFEGANDGILVQEPDTGLIVDANRRAAEMFACGQEQLRGQSLVALGCAAPPLVPEALSERLQAAAAGQPQLFECRARRADGSLFWAEVNLKRATIAGQERLLAVVRDITDRKLAEQELEALNRELEERVAQRTAQLEAVNRELEAFAYTVSHDLRAPLRAMSGFAKALLEDAADRLDDTGRDYARRIANAADRLGKLIDDILELSRLSRAEMHITTVDLSQLARSILEEMRQAEPSRQVEVVVQPGLEAQGDPGLLRVALENLLGNAWKFTSHHPRARIEFGATEVRGRTAFYVRDDGAGFDPKYAHRLFGVFERLHDPDQFPGTGVGLASVKRVVSRHGGEVWAEGEVERGATFYFTLPGARCHAS